MTERNETIAPETDKRAARRDSRLFEFVIGAGVLLISLISLFVAVSANRTQERMLAASVWPSLMFGTSSVSPEGVPEIRLDLDHPVAHAATGSVDACLGGAERRAPQGPVACLLLLGTRRLLAVRQRPRRPRIGAAMPAKAGGPLGRLSGNGNHEMRVVLSPLPLSSGAPTRTSSARGQAVCTHAPSRSSISVESPTGSSRTDRCTRSCTSRAAALNLYLDSR